MQKKNKTKKIQTITAESGVKIVHYTQQRTMTK